MVCKNFYCKKAPCINMEMCAETRCLLYMCENCVYVKVCGKCVTNSLNYTFANSGLRTPTVRARDYSQQVDFNE